MAQRVRIPYRGQGPSSARQLPILAALHAGSPTLFVIIIHHRRKKVNLFLSGFSQKVVDTSAKGQDLYKLMKILPDRHGKPLLFVRFPFIMEL